MKDEHKISTGLPGLDEILKGGLLAKKSYLIQGGPGTGKSTLGLHFLSESSKNGEKGLYITLGETEQSVAQNAESIGLDMSNVSFLDLSPAENLYENSGSQSVFAASEIDQEPLIKAIMGAVEEHNPDRVVLDSITMLRFMNQEPYQRRKVALSFINFIKNHDATLIMISETTGPTEEIDASFWVDGIIKINYQSAWRKLKVVKYRGSDYQSGTHAFKISDKGVTVYPRLRPNNYSRTFQEGILSSGIDEVDDLLNGGIEKGTASLLVGPSGVGKTNLGIQFLKEAASRNERSALYTFEESKEMILKRSAEINVPINEMVDSGNLVIKPIEPLTYSPDEFAKMVRTDIEENNTRMLMLDSIGGYELSIREESILERLHSLSVYLQNMGVTSLLINETQNVTGEFTTTKMNASYLADNIIFLRYFEFNGELRKAIGVLKKRLSGFERKIREFNITSDGIKVGEPLENMQGILSGNPEMKN